MYALRIVKGHKVLIVIISGSPYGEYSIEYQFNHLDRGFEY